MEVGVGVGVGVGVCILSDMMPTKSCMRVHDDESEGRAFKVVEVRVNVIVNHVNVIMEVRVRVRATDLLSSESLSVSLSVSVSIGVMNSKVMSECIVRVWVAREFQCDA